MKRVISALLVLVMVLSLMPALTMEAKAEETDVYTLVEQQIKAYASSINQNDAARTAATALLTNAAFRGKDLTFDESSATTAMIFNSYVFQDGLIHSAVGMIEVMQQLNADALYCSGDCVWRVETAVYGLCAYKDENTEFKNMLQFVASSSALYDSKTALLDKYNANDRMLVSVAGDLGVCYQISVAEVKKETVVYNIDLKAYDGFNYDAEYAEGNYNRDYEELLNLFGSLTLRDFNWESNVSFQLEVPYSCNHSSGSYRWVQNVDTREMICDASEGYLENHAAKQSYSYTNADGEQLERYYYQLDEPIYLLHDKPWIVEYELQNARSLMLSPLRDGENLLPSIIQSSRNYTLIGYYEKSLLGEDSSSGYTYLRHAYGVDLQDQYRYYTTHTYRYTLENVVSEDGSNMIYIAVWDVYLRETVYGPVAMDGYLTYAPGDTEWQQMGEGYTWLNGRDLIINFIGNRTSFANSKIVSVAIYENGIDGESQDTYAENVVAPTCTSEGYTAHTCTKCGYSYNTDYVEMLPHDYVEEVIDPSCTAEGYTSHTCKTCGYSHNTDIVPMIPHDFANYVSNNDATCAHDGTKTGWCTVCGATDTVADEGTALPHNWADATCSKAQTCKVCGGTVGDPLGHDLKYYNAKAPTCTDVGWDAYEKCRRCNHSTFATMPALGHNYVDGVCQNCGDGDVLLGDLTGDGDVDIFDANLIVAYYNGTTELNAAQQKAADVNGNGEIDIFDANLIVSFYNGTIAAFPANE